MPHAYVIRWKQSVQEGERHWYIRRLTEDGSYFGYVHLRTNSVSENRSFTGKLSEAACQRVFEVIGELRSLSSAEAMSAEKSDCMLGIGTAAECEVVIICNRDDGSDAARIFGQLVDVMEPAVLESAGIEWS
jgi:hypothetical protein